MAPEFMLLRNNSIYSRLSDGTPVIVDDYYDESHGVMIAMNQLAEAHDIVLHLSLQSQIYWIKGERPDNSNAKQIDIDGNKVWMTADEVRISQDYLSYLQRILNDRKERIRRLETFIKFCKET